MGVLANGSIWDMSPVLGTFIFLEKDTMTKETYKGKCLIWSSQFKRVRAHDHHEREHGDKQADMALEPLAEGFHLFPQA